MLSRPTVSRALTDCSCSIQDICIDAAKPRGLQNYLTLISQRAKIQGFIMCVPNIFFWPKPFSQHPTVWIMYLNSRPPFKKSQKDLQTDLSNANSTLWRASSKPPLHYPCSSAAETPENCASFCYCSVIVCSICRWMC